MGIPPLTPRWFLLSVFFTILALNGIGSQRVRNPPQYNPYNEDRIVFTRPQTENWDPSQQRQQNAAAANSQNSGVGSFSNGLTDFSTKMLKNLARQNHENIVVSPLSIAVLLAVLQQGASGYAETELSNTLLMNTETSANNFRNVLGNIKSRRSKNLVTLSNAVFVDKTYPLYDNFKQKVRDSFDGQVVSVEFAKVQPTVSYINNWISVATNGKISNLVNTGDVGEDTHSILVNAVYFKGEWQYKFLPKRTRNFPFQPVPNYEVMCSFMEQSGKFVNDEDSQLGARWVELPFDKNEYSMIFILPTAQHELEALIQRITPEDVKKIMSSTEKSQIIVSIPKFDITHKAHLMRTLQEMGVNQIFAKDSGLTKMSPTPIAVSDAIQKAGISIDEKGSVAAAASAITVNTLSIQTNYDNEFTANQPFLALIVDKTHNVPIFMAKIEDPTKSF